MSGRSKAKDNLDKTEKKTRPKLKDYNLADRYQKSFFTTFTLYFKVNVGLKGKILILVLVVNFNAGVVLVLLFFCQFFFCQITFGHAVWCHSQKKENWTFDRECIKDSGKGLVAGVKILTWMMPRWSNYILSKRWKCWERLFSFFLQTLLTIELWQCPIKEVRPFTFK